MSGKLPLVSILVTVHNQLEYLERALRSACNQTYPNLEIVVGDDASTDGDVLSMVKTFDHPKLRYVRQPSNLGRKLNYRSLLFDHANGEWASILNADDFFVNDTYIAQAIDLILSNRDVVMVFGKTGVFIESENKIVVDGALKEIPSVQDGNQLLMNQLKGHIIPHITSVYHRQIAIELDFYHSDILSEDWESLFRIIQGHQVGFVPQLSGLYGRHQNNVSKTIDVHMLLSNLEFIESPYQHGLKLNQVPKEKLDSWKTEMTYRYLVKSYIKVALWDKESLPHLLNEIKKIEPAAFLRIKKDIRIKLFELILGNNFLLRMAFKYYLKQEAVIADFLQYRNKVGKT